MKDSTGKMILGVIIGAAVGAVAGILFAPDKGSVTRKKIADKAKETGDNLKETVTGKFEEVKDFVTETMDKRKNKKNDHHGSAGYYEEETAESRNNS
jgi:gas vesicle protein